MTNVIVCGRLDKKERRSCNETYLSGMQVKASAIREKEKVVLVPPVWTRMEKKMIVAFMIILLCAGPGHAETIYTEASYYTVASCMKESGQAIMANGRRLDDTKKTAASWDWPFGTSLKITNIANGKSCIVLVCDRGPAKRLYQKGRKIDLSKAAFSSLAELKQGIIQVKIEEVSK